jgi:hypothetical protein
VVAVAPTGSGTEGGSPAVPVVGATGSAEVRADGLAACAEAGSVDGMAAVMVESETGPGGLELKGLLLGGEKTKLVVAGAPWLPSSTWFSLCLALAVFLPYSLACGNPYSSAAPGIHHSAPMGFI